MAEQNSFCEKLERLFEKAGARFFGRIQDFHMCHLGMCFLAEKSADTFQIHKMDFTTADPALQELHCDYVVVDSHPEGDAYRTHIHFINVSPSITQCLAEWTARHELRCPHCANL